MALLLSDIIVPITADMKELPSLIAVSFDVPVQSVQAVRIIRQSLDARKKNDIHFKITAVVQMEAIWQARLLKRGEKRAAPYEQIENYTLPRGIGEAKGRITIVGMGPAGLFAAYFLALNGYAPLVVERGKQIEQRAVDVERFFMEGNLLEESNVMFGEGGAGAFSDGKLTARSKDARVSVVHTTLLEHGAPEDIAYMAKPHIGTDILQTVVKRMRESICRLGGEVLFETKLTKIQVEDGRLKAIEVERNGHKERIATGACVLAIGQAARDTLEMLMEKGLVLQAKPFAVGLRVEHPQELINRKQYGSFADHPRLGAAEYALTARAGERGVYTFCMCPGGRVIAAASAQEQVVVNGMSVRARNAGNANAAIIVQVDHRDYGENPLDGRRFAQELERKAFFAGGGGFVAPAQRVIDFMRGDKTQGFYNVIPSYKPGVVTHRLDKLLPGYVTNGIREGLTAFDKQMKGFLLPDAVLTGVETRTSSPVRILRDERVEAVNAQGLFPVGEGAGYAGGIVSAAIDGLRAAEQIASRYIPITATL